MRDNYDDIIHLPHHVSTRHPRMSAIDRAAQFSPFAALSGYDDAIRETLRQTERRIGSDEDEKVEINRKLRYLKAVEAEHPMASFVYFVPDARKEGGEYVSLTAQVRRIDALNQVVWLMNGQSISIDDLLEVDCDLSCAGGGVQP